MRICAGIVLFNPDVERLKKNIEAIIWQVEKIYIIDNGSRNQHAIRKLVNSYGTVSLTINSDNLGIAKALNQMCSLAIEDNYQWILTLDQDSICSVGMLDIMKNYVNNKNIGIICPDIYYEGRKMREKKAKKKIEFVSACMTSASLTNLVAWKTVGGFCDDYFIDYVDNEFCMKLCLHHYKILRVNNCILNHELGQAQQGKFLGIFKYSYSFHTPIRMYYITRNNLAFIRTYSKNLNIVKEYIKVIYILTKNLWVSKQKSVTLKYIFLGIKDYRNKNMGKCKIVY